MVRNYHVTGISHIDGQHGELFTRLDRLLDACVRGAGNAEFRDIVSFLTTYVLEHFAAEEELQLVHGYPAFQEHRSQHATFMHNLEFVRHETEANRITPALIMQVNQLLIDWLATHIATHDRAMGDFISPQLA